MTMEKNESFERIWESLSRAASCCRELAVITNVKGWKELSAQLLIARENAKAMYKSKPLEEFEVISLVDKICQAQIASGFVDATPPMEDKPKLVI